MRRAGQKRRMESQGASFDGVKKENPVPAYQGVRKRSAAEFAGLPIYDIAWGPNLEKGELRGHARGIIAVGDIATGWLAVGGIARGLCALGGVSFGVIALGGCAFGLLGIGGLAIGGAAIGGLGIGGIALGGGAFGYYACGGAAAGKHSLSSLAQDPAAVEFFRSWLPWFGR